MKSILLITQTKSNQSPNQFFEILHNLRIKDYSFKRYYLSSNKKINMLAQLVFPFFRFKLNRFIKKNEFNILFSTGLISDILVLLHSDTCKKVCFIRGHLPTVYKYRFPYFNIGYKLGLFHYYIASKYDQVVVMTDVMKKEFEKITKKKSILIYNYATPIIKNIEELNHINKLKRINKVINFGIVGNLINAKGIEDAIKAFSYFAKYHKNVKLCIYGDGNMQSFYERYAKSLIPKRQFKFHGYIKNKLEIYKNISILIHPSFSEGTSRAVLEALCMHILVIHRSIKGSDELIKDGFNGYLFHDDKSLINCLENSFNKFKNFEFKENKNIEYYLPNKFKLEYFKKDMKSFLAQIK